MLGRIARIAWICLPPLVWMAAILWMSGRSDLPVRTNPQTGETIKTTFTLAKMAHVFEYSVLGLLLLRAVLTRAGGLGLKLAPAIAVTVVCAGLFGGLDEFWQSLTPLREPRLTDVALDTASALAACLGVALWRRTRLPVSAPGSGTGADVPSPAPSGRAVRPKSAKSLHHEPAP